MADSFGGEGGAQAVLRDIADCCKRHQWSAAIRLLGTLPNLLSSPVLLCNRALCYNKLELYKHAVRDCNSALGLNSRALQAYVYKGEAMVALGKREEGSVVWQHGYEAGLGQPSDLEMVLRLQSLAMQTDVETNKASKGDEEPPLPPVQSEEVVTQPSKEVVLSSKKGNKNERPVREKRQPKYQTLIIRPDLNLGRGIAQVNAGNYAEAIQTFSQMLKDNPKSSAAFVGRGTAYAFQRKLPAAIDDFSKAIDLDSSLAEAWKRRGQARTAVGLNLEAVADLSHALELDPKSGDIHYERGVVHFKLKDFQLAVEDLRTSIAADSKNKYAYNYFGMALTTTGEYEEAKTAHRKAIELDSGLKEAWTHLAKLHKELGDAENALNCLQKALAIDKKFALAYRLKGSLLFGMGDHRGAAKELTIGLEVEPSNPDFRYLRGSCYHATGLFSEAVKDYDNVLSADVGSVESRTLQFLAFYQRETALYAASKWDKPFKGFDIDRDLDPMFKEAWCKRHSPMLLFPAFHRQSLPRELSGTELTPADLTLNKRKKTLLKSADRLGLLIQYNCPGFLKNVRQHRMAGLAVLEIAQKVTAQFQCSRIIRAQDPTRFEVLQTGVEKAKANEVQNKNSPPSQESHACVVRWTWRDLYSIAVKWRQVSEPCDPVVWVDMLSEKGYAAGFGSHTPLLLGQAKVVRYYPNFPRALGVAKSLINSQRFVYNAANRKLDLSDPDQLLSVDAAKNCGELHKAIGEDFWIVTRCHSTRTQGKILDGTRFTLQKPSLNGYDFSIKTPCTPSRWAEYDEELTAAWEDYCDLNCKRNESPDNCKLLTQLKDSILRLSFYWYNFMPLARGTAVVGYVMLLGLFLAADLEVGAAIPEGVQVDWEAILSKDLEVFTESVKSWLYPCLKKDTSWRSLPSVSETFFTFRSVVGALSGNY